MTLSRTPISRTNVEKLIRMSDLQKKLEEGKNRLREYAFKNPAMSSDGKDYFARITIQRGKIVSSGRLSCFGYGYGYGHAY